MTICVAALCHDDDGEARAVVAADRMVTLGGFIEFEHAVPKMAVASASAVVMVAGDTLTGTRLAREVSEGFNGTTPRLVDIGQALASCYEQTRHRQIEAQLLAPRGLRGCSDSSCW